MSMEDLRYKRDESVAYEKYGESYVIIPLRRLNGAIEDNVFILDEVAARVWELLATPHTLAGMRDEIFQEYDAGISEIEKDLRSYLEDLLNIQAITGEE